MALLAGVENPYVSGSHEWNGNSALLIARPMDTIQMIMVSGTANSPLAEIRAMDSFALDINRCPVIS